MGVRERERNRGEEGGEQKESREREREVERSRKERQECKRQLHTVNHITSQARSKSACGLPITELIGV